MSLPLAHIFNAERKLIASCPCENWKTAVMVVMAQSLACAVSGDEMECYRNGVKMVGREREQLLKTLQKI